MIIKIIEAFSIQEHSAGDQEIAAQIFLDKFPTIGTKESVHRRLERLKRPKPKKPDY